MKKTCTINHLMLLFMLLWVCTSVNANAKSVWNEDGILSIQSTDATTEIDILPFKEDFSGSTALPEEWESTGLSTATIDAANYYLTPNSAKLGDTKGNAFLVAPMLLGYNANMLMVKYDLKASNVGLVLEVGVMTDPTDPTTFVALDKAYVVSTDWSTQAAYLSNYTGEGNYIAFKVVNGYTANIDNITIDMTPSCIAVNNLRINDAAETSAQIAWNEPSGTDISELYKIVEYKESSESTWTIISSTFISGTSYVLTGLTIGTNYDVRVYCTCGSGQYSDTLTTSFTTMPQLCIDLPIGKGTTAFGHTPVAGYMNNSYSQSLYMKSEMNGSRTITGIAYQLSTSTNAPAPLTRNISIYLGHTSITVYPTTGMSLANLVTTGLTLVYSGEVLFSNAGEGGWLPIEFDIPFNYDGDSTLAVTVIAQGTTTISGNRFLIGSSDASTRPTTYAYNATTAYTPTNVFGTMYGHNSRVNTTFLSYCPEEPCYSPNVLTISDISTDKATASWIDQNTASDFELEYKTATRSEWTTIPTGKATSYIFENLRPATKYDVRVRALCSNDTTSWRATTTFTTIAVPCETTIQIPFYENFDALTNTEFPTCWNRWTVGYNNNSSITSTETDVYTYPSALNLNNTELSYNITALPAIHENFNITDLQVSFSAKKGDIAQGTFMLGIMDDPNNIGTFELIDTIRFTGTAWANFHISLENYIGTGRHIAFLWKSGNTTLYVDELYVSARTTCASPLAVTIGTLIGNRTLPITITDDVNSKWLYTIASPGVPINWDNAVETTDKNFTIYVAPNKRHNIYVRAICSDEVTSIPISTTYRNTLCDTITEKDLPLIENFDGKAVVMASTVPDCWELIRVNSYPYIISAQYQSPPNSLVFYSSTSNSLGTGMIGPFDLDMSKIRIQFSIRVNASVASDFVIALSKNKDNVADIIVLDTITVPTGGWTRINMNIDSAKVDKAYHYIMMKVGTAVTSSTPNVYVDDLVIDLIPFCSDPIHVKANVQPTEATIDWTSTAAQYAIKYGEKGFDFETAGEVLTIEKPYTISSLLPNKSYDIYIKSICDEYEISNWSEVYTFTTSTVPAEVPYTTDFEDENENNNWVMLNGNTINKWHFGSAASKSGNGLYVSDDGGVHNHYTTTDIANSTTYIYASRLINISEIGAYSLEFDWRSVGRNAWDVMRVFLVPDYITIENGNAHGMSGQSNPTPENWIDIGNGTFYGSSDWVSENKPFSIITPGNYNLVFFWKSYGLTNSTQTPSAIDNVNLYKHSCARPVLLEARNVTPATATISWVQQDAAVSWEIEYGIKGFARGTGTTVSALGISSKEITGLIPGRYIDVYIRAICGEGDTSVWSSVFTFTSECAELSQFPYAVDFDGNYAVPGNPFHVLCWNGHVDGIGTTALRIGNDNSFKAPSAPNFLDFGSDWATVNYALVTLPKIANEVSLQDLQISFKANHNSISGIISGTISIGVMDAPDDYASYTPFYIIDISSSSIDTWHNISADLLSYEGTGKYIAIKREGSTGRFLVDDVVLDYNPNICKRMPSAPEVSNITANTAQLSWAAGRGETSYLIDYKLQSASSLNYITITTEATNYTLTNLTEGTLYEVRIRSNCSRLNPQHVVFQTLKPMVTVTPSAGANGKITPNAPVQIARDANQVFAFVPEHGYVVDNITVNGSPVSTQDNPSSYTLSSVQNNSTIHVTFKAAETVVADTVTIYAMVNNTTYGTITPAGLRKAKKGDSPAYTIRPNTGYELVSVEVNNASITLDTAYTFTNVQENSIICAIFAPKTTITATADENGVITPSGDIKVEYGTNKTFTFFPKMGYEIKDVTVNGESKGTPLFYTFSNVRTDASISVTFKVANMPLDTFIITAEAGAHGSISPAGEVPVIEFQSQTFTFAPEEGYIVKSVFVDGNIVTTENITSYTIEKVMANMTIHVEFDVNSIKQHILDNSVTIYPNPTQDNLNVKMEASFDNVEITNLLGQVIYTVAITGSQELEISVANYRSGVYLIRLQGEHGVVVKKFIKE